MLVRCWVEILCVALEPGLSCMSFVCFGGRDSGLMFSLGWAVGFGDAGMMIVMEVLVVEGWW